MIFQVFTFENGLSPIGYFKRSFEIIKGHFAGTFSLLLLLVVLTYILLSSGLSVIFDCLNWTKTISKAFEVWAFILPIEPLEQYGVTPAKISKVIFDNLVMFITIGFTLPLRSICWTLWYNNLAEPVEQPKNLTKKKSTKKNVKAKTFKIEKREIDPEIIRRARLEDDEY